MVKICPAAGRGKIIYNEEVKTDLTTSGTTAHAKARALAAAPDTKIKIPEQKAVKPEPDYKVDLSSKLPAAPVPPVPVPSLPKPEKIEKAAATEVVKASLPEAKAGSLKKNAIIFIKGLDVFSSPSNSERGYAGVGRLAESVEGSRIYGWDQKDEIIKEVMKVHPDYKVVLVGHSMGGDTAVEVADELATLENKFRTVDLLVTMDAVGSSNDIIPQNVKRHLNVFGENDIFLNDGPHVARKNAKTEVTNILSPRDHVEIDDDKDIQYEVVNLIQKTLGGVS